MAEGQEYAVTLPRSNAAGLFAQSFIRSRQTAEQRDILQQQQAAKAAADRKKQDDDDIKEVLKYTDGISAGFKDVKEFGREGVDATMKEMNNAIFAEIQEVRAGKKKVDPIRYREIASQYIAKAKEIDRWSTDVDAVGTDMTKYYSNIPGVNANGVKQLTNLAVKNLGATAPVEKVIGFVRKNIGALVENRKGVEEHWKGLGTYSAGIGTGANGAMTAGRESKTIQVDSEIEGKGMGSKVIPKGETINLNELGYRDEGMDATKKAPWEVSQNNTSSMKIPGMVSAGVMASPDLLPGKEVDWNNNKKKNRVIALEGLADESGNLRMYDEKFYQNMMENEGAKLWIDKLFNKEVRRYEDATGQPFPQSEQIEEMAKRAIAYKERAAVVDGKHNAVSAQPVYHHTTVVNNAGGKAAEGPVIREIQKKIDRAAALSPDGVLAIKLPGDQGKTVLQQASESLRDPDKIKKLNSQNVGVRKTPEGSMIYWVNNSGVKEDLHLMEESATDTPLQVYTKAKLAINNGGGTPAAAAPAKKNKPIVSRGTVQ